MGPLEYFTLVEPAFSKVTGVPPNLSGVVRFIGILGC